MHQSAKLPPKRYPRMLVMFWSDGKGICNILEARPMKYVIEAVWIHIKGINCDISPKITTLKTLNVFHNYQYNVPHQEPSIDKHPYHLNHVIFNMIYDNLLDECIGGK